MPCYDDRDDPHAYCYEERNRLDKTIAEQKRQIDSLTDMLCAACREIERTPGKFENHYPRLITWWEKHKKEDEEKAKLAEKLRKEREAAETEKAKQEREKKLAQYEQLKKELGLS